MKRTLYLSNTLIIQLVDIETSLKLVQTFPVWNANISFDCIVEDTKILTWASKNLYTKEVHYDSCHHYNVNKKSIKTDKPVVKSLCNVLKDADIVIWHYGNGFDYPIIKSRAMQLGLPPLKPFKSVDTKKAIGHLGFTSKKLDALGRDLGVGRKVEHTGKKLWQDYLLGDKEAQELMVKYNIGDVDLLEAVYLKLLPEIKGHPNLSLMLDERVCPQCGGHELKQSKLEYMYYGKMYNLHSCKTCKAWSIEHKEGIMRHIL